MSRPALLPVPMAPARSVLDRPPRVIVDLRSPAEHAEDHLPGALSLPLFDDLERALVGTLYARSSPQAAFEKGRELTLAKISSYTAAIAAACGWRLPATDLEEGVRRLTAIGIEGMERELAPDPVEPGRGAVVLYCWRGGLRSRAMVSFLRGLGRGEVVGLEGGYRAYRRCVRERIAAWEAPPGFVLRGLTGVGKTLVLRALTALRPEWTLDLELMAGHRSSILGMVGLEPASQKLFETRLAARLARGFGGLCVVEGESRKVGDLVVPEPVWRVLDAGVAIELRAPLAVRVRVLCDDYLASARSREELARQLPFIETRLGPRWAGELVARLNSGREAELVELLLEHYYDPLYRHSERGRRYEISLDASDPAATAGEIVRWIEARTAAGVTRAGAAPEGRAADPRRLAL